jgi:hypothetical protein
LDPRRAFIEEAGGVINRRGYALIERCAMVGRIGRDASTQFFGVFRKNASFFKRRFFLATKLESNAEARWLASVIENAVRRRAA